MSLEDVLAPCRCANYEMAETERVRRHLLKDISEGTFQALLFQNLTMVKDVTRYCQHLQEAQNSRIQMPPSRNIFLSSERLSMNSLRTLIQEIVRVEIAKAHHLTPTLIISAGLCNMN